MFSVFLTNYIAPFSPRRGQKRRVWSAFTGEGKQDQRRSVSWPSAQAPVASCGLSASLGSSFLVTLPSSPDPHHRHPKRFSSLWRRSPATQWYTLPSPSQKLWMVPQAELEIFKVKWKQSRLLTEVAFSLLPSRASHINLPHWHTAWKIS